MTNSIADDWRGQDWPRRVAILGVGLLGGSVALSARRARKGTVWLGLARSPEKRERLQRSGIVDVAADSVEATVAGCDVVVVASPVDQIAALVLEAAVHCPAECLITDVGSTKGRIVAAVAADPLARGKFLAAHPIAGSEKTGAEHASPTLFDGKLIVLTPGESTDPKLLAKATHFWQLTGGRTKSMSAAAHDAHLAAVSHVPHLVSALVAKLTRPEARSLVGSGWEDITRVAAGDPSLWTAICQENRQAIGRELARYAEELSRLCRILDTEDDERLWSWLAEAKRVKEQSP
jgi:prephenate dehydrogenase